ncbi:hypothetical protein JCM33374_g2947 [Metschnikowia sp. JCM 33374]|nr:hypothetical protein JCM33374_g2947 [Metschnikowia sp. JCM 33374]
MEKFSNWRDKGTGISPFLPVDAKVSPVRKYAVNPALLAVKWPFFIALYLLASVAPKPATKLILKLLFSVSDIDLSVEGVRKSNTREIVKHKPSKGEIVVSNVVSPLDIFVIFIISTVTSLSSIAVVIPWKNDLYAFTAWHAVSVFFLPLASSVIQGTRIEGNILDHESLKGKLVVVFAEGTASNNKAILPLQSQCSKVLSSGVSVPTKVTVLRYYPGTLTLPIPHMTQAQYVSKMLTLPTKAFVKVKIVPLQNVTLKACEQAFVENGLNRVELGVEQKAEFFKYFQDYSLAPGK